MKSRLMSILFKYADIINLVAWLGMLLFSTKLHETIFYLIMCYVGIVITFHYERDDFDEQKK